MKVRFVGVAIKVGNIQNLCPFLNYLAENNGNSINFGDYERRCYVNNDENEQYVRGLFLTIKSQKTFCELVNNSTINVNTIGKNSSLMDFNFFIINKETGFCMYQHYHNSCSVNQFSSFLKIRFTSFQNLNIENQKKLKVNLAENDIKLINEKYKDFLTWELIIRQEKIDEIFADLDTIQRFSIDFLYLEEVEPIFSPMTSHLRKETKTFNFKPKTSIRSLVHTFKNIISKYSIHSGSIKGRDINGIDRVIQLYENPDYFGEYDYDYVTKELDHLDLNKFYDNWVINQLLEKVKNFKHIFNNKNKL